MTPSLGSRSTWAFLALALASCSKPAPSAPSAQGPGTDAIRLHLHPASSVVPLGTPVDVTVALRDFHGDRTSAPRALEIELSVEKGPRRTLEFKPGDTEMDVFVTPTREGIQEIRAAGPALVTGSCFVKVTRPEPSQARARHVPRIPRP